MTARSKVRSAPGPNHDDREAWTRVSFLGAIFVHLLLGIAVIRQNPAFWLDEYMGFAVVSGNWEEAVRFFRSMPEQHPLHYLFLWVWVQFGDSEAWLRAHSLLLSTGTVWVLALLSRRLLQTPWVSQAAVWTFALSPFVLTFATEARMYSLLMLLSAASLLLLIRAIRRRAVWDWIGYAAVAGMCAWTHFFGVLLVVSLGLVSLWVFRNDRAARGPLVWVHLAIAFLFLPWLFLIVNGRATDGQGWKGIAHLILSAPYTALRFALGYGALPVYFNWQAAVTDDLPRWIGLIATAVAGFGLATVFYVGALVLPRRRQASRPTPRTEQLQVLAALAGPMLLTFVLAPLVILAGDRYFVVSFPAFLIAIWSGIEWARRSPTPVVRLGGGVAAVLIVVSIGWATSSQILRQQSPGTEWREVAAFLGAAGASAEPVVLHPRHIEGIAEHYLATGPERRVGPLLPLSEWTPPDTLDRGWLVLSHTMESAEEALAAHSVALQPVHCRTFPRGAGIRLYQLVPAGVPDPVGCELSAVEPVGRRR